MQTLPDRKILVAVAGILLLAGVVAVWAIRSSARAGQLAKVRELGDQLMGESGRHLPAEQRREMAGELRKEMGRLSGDQRRELMQDRRQAMQQEMDKFFVLSKPEQVAMLDKRIDEMEVMRQRFESTRSQKPPAGSDATGDGRWRSRTPPTKQQREQRSLRFLNHTTPEERAKMTEFMKMLRKRREERGLPEMTFPRRGTSRPYHLKSTLAVNRLRGSPRA